MSSGDLIPRIYSNFRGVDFRGDEINLTRSPDALNMWKDYKKTESISTRPGMELLSSFDETVWGIYFFNDKTIVHCGTKLLDMQSGETLYDGVNNGKSDAFIFNNNWFFKDGVNYLQYNGTTIKEVEGYVPTTSIGRRGDETPGGTTYEDVNMLSDWRYNTFRGGDARYEEEGVGLLMLDAQDLDDLTGTDEENEIELWIDGKEVWKEYRAAGKVAIDYIGGVIVFYSSFPPAPSTEGQDNVKVKFKKSVGDEGRNKIKKCTLLQVFDNRVFFSGNPDYPNMVWHCSLNDPTYCSDLDYYNEGLDTSAVKGMVAANNALWVFKEPSQANTTAFYHTPTIDAEYGKIYPNSHSSISTGCVGKAINFNDDIVFFSDRGMEGVSGDITSEQFLAHRSSLVDRKLIAEPDYANMLLEEWEGYLLVIIGNKVYLADSRAMFQNNDHNEYEWFYWELPHNITCSKVNKGVLYLGTENGVYSLTDTDSGVNCHWVTPKDKFKHPQYLKTTNKRGCTIEATGRISVYAKTEKNEGFTEDTFVGTYPDSADENTIVEDFFVSRIKRKKFKDIQLKFASNKPFRLETVTLECFVGGYIKR